MDVKNLSQVVMRLKPFIRNQKIQRSRFERALTAMKIPDLELRLEIERLLTDAGFEIEEDADPLAPPDPSVANSPKSPSIKRSDTSPETSTESAIASAKRRIDRDRYTRDPAKVLLRPEEEVGLALLVRGETGKPLEAGGLSRLRGDSRRAANCLLLHNQRLVRWVAQKYVASGMDYEDLFQHGVIGLIRAVELFDPNQGHKFSTYAYSWVRQAITRGIANEGRMIRLPAHMVERVNKVWATRSRLAKNGRPPTLHDLALACALTEDQISECMTLGRQDMLSLDMPVNAESETTLGDLVDRKDGGTGPESAVEFRMMQQLIDDVLDTLDDREARIMRLRYGLYDGEKWTLDQIGNVYGLSRERIRQLETKALAELRDPRRSSVLESFLYGGDSRGKSSV